MTFLALVLALQVGSGRIDSIEVEGNVRVPSDTIRLALEIQPGDFYDLEAIRRDIRALYALGLFATVRVEGELTADGTVVTFRVRERPFVTVIDYSSIDSIDEAEVVERLLEQGISLRIASPYDPVEVLRAESVVRQLLVERGREAASVRVEVHAITPTRVGLEFVVEEGPRLKIESIDVVGNQALSDRDIKSAMELTKETGPISSLKSQDLYSGLRMSDSISRIETLYRERGYIRAIVTETGAEVRPHEIHRTLPFVKPSLPWGIPLPFWKRHVDRYFLTFEIEENDPYRIGDVRITGAAQLPEEELLSVLGMVGGEVYNGTKFLDSLTNLARLYGNRGYIDLDVVPVSDIDEETKTVHLTVNLQEGRQFSVNRIDFRGNTTTRDRIIRRELAVAEGDVFSTELWELGLDRLNLLGYFELLTTEATEFELSASEPEVDITLTVRERDQNFVGLTGGVAPIGGGFAGVNYETNNFLGLGEQLSVTLEGGSRQSNFSFRFLEPYLFDRPVSAGFSVFRNEFRFEHPTEVFGDSLPQAAGFQDERNFDQSQFGFNVFASHAFNGFHRVGMAFDFDDAENDRVNPATDAFFESVRQKNGPPPWTTTGTFRTQALLPTYRWSTIEDSAFPVRGQSVEIGLRFAGAFLGGNVNYVQSSFEYQLFKPVNQDRNTLAFRFQAAYMQGHSATHVPFSERLFSGGDFDIRGFDFRSLGPLAFVGRETTDTAGQPVSFDDVAYVGGDATAVANLEYRIPVAGNTLTFVPFLDVGNSWAARRDQLRRSVVQPDGTMRLEDVQFLPGTNSGLRSSTGAEMQIMLPIIAAPLRFIYAFNPLRLDRVVTTPRTGQSILLRDKSSVFKFTIGKTF